MDPLQVYAFVEVLNARIDPDSGAHRPRQRIDVAVSPMRRREKRRPGGRRPGDGHPHQRRPRRFARTG